MRKADNLPPFLAAVTKSGNLNFLEPSAPVHACNGADLPLPLPYGHFIYVSNDVRIIGNFSNPKWAREQNIWKTLA